MALHSVWGPAAPPWEPAEQTDGTPSIRTAAGFYGVSTALDVVGGRLRAPAGSALTSVTLALRTAAVGAVPDLGAAPLASGVASVTPGGWATASWTGVEVAAGTVAWISVESSTAVPDTLDNVIYQFVSSGTVGLGPTQATDASDLWWAERNSVGVEIASAFRVGAGSTEASTAWYGLDIIVSDGAVDWPVSGSAAATATASGTITAQLGVSGTASAAATASGAITAQLAVSGSASAVATASGRVTGGTDATLPSSLALDITTPGRTLDIDTPGWTLEVA